MPVGPWHVTTGALNLHTHFVEPLNRIAYILQAAHLSGNLITGYARSEPASPAYHLTDTLIEQNKCVMIVYVPHKIASGVSPSPAICSGLEARRE
jgi:hypothetical protein